MDKEKYALLTLMKRKLRKLYSFQIEQTSQQEKLLGIKKGII